MESKITKLFTILVTALFLAAPVTALDFADDNFSIEIDVDTRHPTLGEDLDFIVNIENLHEDLDFEDVDVTIWLSDQDDDRVGDKIKEDFNKISQKHDEELTYAWLIPGDIDDGTYTLNVEVEGDWEDSDETTTYLATAEVDVERPEHGLYFKDLDLSTSTIDAGENLDVSVVLQNIGEKDEFGVKIALDIIELGVSNEVELLSDLLDGRKTTQYLALEIPEDVEAGDYELRVRAYNSYVEVITTKAITIDSAKDVSEPTQDVVRSGEVLTPGKGNIISLQVKNHDSSTKTLTLEIEGVDWGTARVDPTAVTLEGGDETVAFVHIVPDEDATGKQTFTFVVKDGKTVLDSTNFEVTVGEDNIDNMSTNLLILFILAVLVYFFYQRTRPKAKAY